MKLNDDTFGLFCISKNQGSSVDSPEKAKHSQEQQESAHGKKDFAAEQKYSESKDNESQSVAPPKR